MIDKIQGLWPEIVLLTGGVVCLLFGMSKSLELRRLCSWVAVASLIFAAALAPAVSGRSVDPVLAGITVPLKTVIAGMGIILMLVIAYVPSQVKQVRIAEASDAFEPADTMRGEFYFFFLSSLAGAMMCASASDLPWLFLALELTSLPTYVMIATSRDRVEAQESAVKYFFLGALSAAIFLYGFALMYGATGSTDFATMRAMLAHGGAPSDLFTLGLVLAIVGISFKIAAFPMHFYAADVYQGATSALTAYLAFVPKAAGFAALALLLSLTGDMMIPAVAGVLIVMAAITMCLGNALALVQSNVKRMLAYSSVAHSGYLLMGLLAGTAGLKGIVVYLLAYGAATVTAFAALGLLTVREDNTHEPREAETFDDLNGLVHRHPALAAALSIAMLSLIGLPPLAGFLGKLALFTPTFEAGYGWLVVLAVLNTAISAAYYLRVVVACFTGRGSDAVQMLPAPGRKLGVGLAAGLVLAVGLFGARIIPGASVDPDSETPERTTPPVIEDAYDDAANLDASPALTHAE